tara:strand:+ start:2162 stop:2749 length:588 start_codon:yes stop_codon:yes gene_type:complete
MIDMSMGPIHISSGPGSDSSSMSLTIVLRTLEKENKVIWMTRNLPDQRKILDILGHLDDSILDRMIVIEFGDELRSKLNGINGLLTKLEKNDLLIIENWCENYGRAKAEETSLMKKLVEDYEEIKIIITSESYEDASGKNRGLRGFMSRGGEIIEDSFRTVWLTKIDNQYQKVLITDGENELLVESTRKGYQIIN